MKLQKVLNSTRRFLKRNGSTILTVIGVCGGVYAAVKAVKETPKALDMLEDAETFDDFSSEPRHYSLTTWGKIRVVAPVYIFPAVVGVASIACLLGANILSRKQQASLMSAYVLLDRSFKEYRNAAKRVYGEDADEMIQRDIMIAEYAKMTSLPHGDLVLFYDTISDRYFYSTSQAVTEAENDFNRNFALRGYVNLNEFYDFLGLPETMGGDIIGWDMDSGFEFYGYQYIDFVHREEHLQDGSTCYAIIAPFAPHPLFEGSEDETDQYDRVPQTKQVIY